MPGKRALITIGILLALTAACLAVPIPDDARPTPRVVVKGFRGRTDGQRPKLVKQEGGNGKSEAAVAAGLQWIARHQAPDGRFSLDKFAAAGQGCRCDGRGKVNDMAGTGLALLPFLGAGESHKGTEKTHRYNHEIERALKWLIAKQGADGDLGEGYAHGINTIALCEAYGMTGDPWLKGHAQRAVNCTIAWQAKDGGFRYQPRMAGDSSVTGWHVQGLRAAAAAELKMPKATWQGIDEWFDSVASKNGGFGYNAENKEAAPAVTSIGLLYRLHRGVSLKHAEIVKGNAFLQGYAPDWNSAGTGFKYQNIYYFYHAHQVKHRLGGPEWEKWNPLLRDMLIKTQDQTSTHKKGSWWPVAEDGRPSDAWPQLGRLGHTAFAVLILEEYYRSLP